MSFRRRMGMSGGELTLSSYSSTVSAASGNTTISIYYNGTKINFSECTYSMTGKINSVTVESNGNCKISYIGNSSSSSVQSTATIEYRGISKQYTLTQGGDYQISTTVTGLESSYNPTNFSLSGTRSYSGNFGENVSGSGSFSIRFNYTYKYNAIYQSGRSVSSTSSTYTNHNGTTSFKAYTSGNYYRIELDGTKFSVGNDAVHFGLVHGSGFAINCQFKNGSYTYESGSDRFMMFDYANYSYNINGGYNLGSISFFNEFFHWSLDLQFLNS